MKFYFIFIVFLIITKAYNQFPQSFTKTAQINDGGCAVDVAIGSGGTVFLADYIFHFIHTRLNSFISLFRRLCLCVCLDIIKIRPFFI